MNLQEYIRVYYDSASEWFVDEVEKYNHRKRIDNIFNIKAYLNGKHAIKSRPDETYNGRTFKTRKIVLQYVKPILSFETSFLLNRPVTLTATDKDTLKTFKDMYSKSKYNDLDFKILDKLVKYGQVFEYIYLDDNKQIRSKLINVEDSYPVFSDSGDYIAFIEHYTIATSGISYYKVFTPNMVATYDNYGGDGLRKTGEYINLSGLPIMYKTDNEEDSTQGRSDIEDYIDILDNMEDLISKYMDSFYKFLNPIPTVTGTKLNIGKNGEGAVNPATVGHVLQLDDGSSFDLVTNKMDYQSLKELYGMLKQSLLDVSMTPAVSLNNTDISNLSEVSIKLLFSLAQIKGSINSKYMKEGFNNRWEKMKRLMQLKGVTVSGNIDCNFEMNVPQNEKEIIENLKELREMNAISLDSLLSQTPYIYDVEGEKERIQGEQKAV
ncbi:phage portal protein [Clostridium ganghwense]|uniref:Phage portal protein n=1 Tax=Clostridium ganghwense TaxID=312089 RepID=A0ABT4CUN6_9CLOT|nr:phage portal protein [Clostridium ganghwense]MCY6372774.1 phage portal protein [Clostridium ganghwense]